MYITMYLHTMSTINLWALSIYISFTKHYTICANHTT